mgnify:CR=1 FL=1
MNAKKLEPNSEYAKYDADGDGVVSDAELATTEKLQELEILFAPPEILELLHEKADSQKQMAWVAMISMCLFAILPVMPFVPESRLSTLSSLSDMLFLSQAGVVGLYFGATAFMSRNGKQ